jgi:hydroxymethylglutaryl-CoA lyase
VEELILADSIGCASPLAVYETMKTAVARYKPLPVGLHLHSVLGAGPANAFAALQAGVRLFDTACSGLGSCPYVALPAGNLPTESLVWMLRQMDIDCAVEMDAVLHAVEQIKILVG